MFNSTRDTHHRAPATEGKGKERRHPRSPALGALRPCPDYILLPMREMTLAHCSGAKQTPPTISWAWALRADARRNLKEAGYFGCWNLPECQGSNMSA